MTGFVLQGHILYIIFNNNFNIFFIIYFMFFYHIFTILLSNTILVWRNLIIAEIQLWNIIYELRMMPNIYDFILLTAQVLPPITGDVAHDHPSVIRSPGSKWVSSRASSCWSRGRSTVRRCPAGCRPSGCGTGARGVQRAGRAVCVHTERGEGEERAEDDGRLHQTVVIQLTQKLSAADPPLVKLGLVHLRTKHTSTSKASNNL